MMHPTILYPPRMDFLSPSVLPRRKYTWTLISKRSLLICFENCQGAVCFKRQSRKRMMGIFIMVNLTLNVRDSLEDKSMLAHSKKDLVSPCSFVRKRIYLGTHLKKDPSDLFWKLPGTLFSHAEQKSDDDTLLTVNITPTCCSLIFILCKEKMETRYVSPPSTEYFGIKPTTFLTTNWPWNTCKMNCWICFVIGVAIKVAAAVIWCKLQCPCANLMIWGASKKMILS